MESIATVVTALAAGAAAAAAAASDEAVKDAYDHVRSLLLRKYGDVDLSLLEARPESAACRKVAAQELVGAGVADDQELLAGATQLLQLIQDRAPQLGDVIGVDLSNIKGASLRLRGVSTTGSGNVTGVRVQNADVGGDIEISGVQAGGSGSSSTQIITGGGDYVVGDKVGGDKVGGDKVEGDKTTVGKLTGTGIAIGMDARAEISGKTVRDTVDVSTVDKAPYDVLEKDEIRLDVAGPQGALVGEPFEIVVAVRKRQSPHLACEGLTKVVSQDSTVFRSHAGDIARYRVSVAAAGCTIEPADGHLILLHSGEDSESVSFQVTSPHIGTHTIFVDTYQEVESLASRSGVGVQLSLPIVS